MPVFYVALAALAGALVAVAAYHFAVVRPAQQRVAEAMDVHDGLIAGGAGGAASRLASLEAGHGSVVGAIERLQERIARLEGYAEKDISLAGFLRFDAFNDAESGLSYALALLNRRGDGVVLSSIYSREDSRTYGKAVEGFTPAAHALDEELRAIERARSSAS